MTKPAERRGRRDRTGGRLVFVYNVDARPIALLRDLYQGLTTGATDCHLCDITFGRLLKDRNWKQFVRTLPMEVEFSLRSTFTRAHPEISSHFPAAFLKDPADKLIEVISASEINAVTNVDDLAQLVLRAVDRGSSRSH